MSKIVSLVQVLTRKIMLSLLIIFLFSFFFLTYFFIKKFENDFNEKIYLILSQSADALVSFTNSENKVEAQKILKSLKKYEFIKASQVTSINGEIIAKYGDNINNDSSNHFRRLIYDESSSEGYVLGVVEIFTDDSQLKEFIYDLSRKTFLLASLILLVIILTLKKTINYYISPIEKISDEINQIENVKKINISREETSIKEIYKLYNALSKMKRIYSEYQEELETQVAERTYELEEYRAHLEAMVEEKTKDYLEAKEEADRANNQKSQFLANITHELRTPMHAMINYSDLGNENLEESADLQKLKKYFNNINKSGKRLLKIINDLLDVSKYQSGMQQLVFSENDLKEIFDSVVMELGGLLSKRVIGIKFDSSVKDYKVECDEEKIFHVMMNLLSNSIKFSPDNSVIDVSVEGGFLDVADKKIESIAFKVTDSGPGIPKDELEDIFEKFVQSSATKSGAGGTGLGLSISKEIIEAHGGQIWAENLPNKGAIFTFILPKKIIMKFSDKES